MKPRRISKAINIGGVTVGGGAPIVVQSMTKTFTNDVMSTIRQIKELEEYGCQIIRVAVPDKEAAEALPAIKKGISIPLIADMLGRSFERGYQTMWEQAQRAHSTSPYFHPKYTRLAVMDGEIVGHVRIQPNVFKLGDARLWVAGIGDVATHLAHRKKGIARALMNEAVEFMEKEEFDISILFGIPNFYHRFGFAPIIPPHPVVSVPLDSARNMYQSQ